MDGPGGSGCVGQCKMPAAASAAIAAVILMLIVASAPAFAADPDNGERLAHRWCSSCHVVAADQRGPTSEAPPFATIAHQPGFDAAKIAFFLLDPHPRMPNMQLSRTEAADIAAYIATLK
jgi:mono/diheme cytochrome c family protein